MNPTKEENTRPIQDNHEEIVSWEFDLSNIPDSFQFGNAKVEKRFSFFKAWIFLCWVTIGICVGIILSYLIIYLC